MSDRPSPALCSCGVLAVARCSGCDRPACLSHRFNCPACTAEKQAARGEEHAHWARQGNELVAAIRSLASSGSLPRLPIGKLGWRRNKRVVEPTGGWCLLIADEVRLMDRNEWPIVPGVALTEDQATLMRGKKEELITPHRWLPDTTSVFFSVDARYDPVRLEEGATLYADVLTREHPELRALLGVSSPKRSPSENGVITEPDLSTGPMPPENEVGYFEQGTYHLMADPDELAKVMGIPAEVITAAAAMDLPPWYLLGARDNPYTAAPLRNAGIDWGARYADGRYIPTPHPKLP